MSALLNDAAVLQDQDIVGMSNGSQTVGNDQHRAMFSQSIKGFLDRLFR